MQGIGELTTCRAATICRFADNADAVDRNAISQGRSHLDGFAAVSKQGTKGAISIKR
jgi:hypothetical protein